MATPHIGAEKGQIAETILLPGDPLRAKYIAETFLEDVVQYNNVRGMLGFTGTYKGKRISVQGTGMGIPSIGIYSHELISEFGVKNLIRIGTAGSYQEDLKLRDVVIAMSASTDSAINKLRFNGADYAPTANADMVFKAYEIAKEKGMNVKAGNVFTSDTFYGDDPEAWKKWAKFGVLCVEMETAQLYTTAAKLGAKALTLLTISDSFITSEVTTAEERQTTFNDMIVVALETAISL
ncbi:MULTISPECIES: purine-nucleoside phosphorylase [unclassified Leptotrichia]|jgi:purine nucleoside phosphorylase|uniref:purine-nucleoside phosphorylase n=1 Tax=unclassified Leptotrichia TaxID=2633022 RepID=UPI0017C77523|nr:MULTISPECIES: purine-nucleoside phosphorylase [unclassified Leptotrichia]MBB1534402.1 purine-nucleoside phosphorylase [Leptotrichia sp.]QUB96504.1 purine-nucleoside phosphorylase [Leptotrichia sp. oral taxon 221]